MFTAGFTFVNDHALRIVRNAVVRIAACKPFAPLLVYRGLLHQLADVRNARQPSIVKSV